MTPNRIVLISNGRYDEAPAAADVYPGMALLQNSAGNIIAHNIVGGGGELNVCQEDALQGKTILTKIASGDVCPFRRATRGDLLLMLLQAGQSVTALDPLMSAGDGTLIACPTNVLKNIVAASTTITSTASETTFSNGSYSLPANFLVAGDVLRIRAKAYCIAENSTNTHRVRLYINSTTLADSTALQLAAADVVIIELALTVRTIGSSGTIIADGFLSASVSGTYTTNGVTLASTTLDTTAAATIAIKSLASAANAGNQIRLDEYRIEVLRNTGVNVLVYAAETKDNSGSTGTSVNNAMFIRAQVP